ncbi:MAG: hypothetical protein Q7K44_00080 [Candidatus Liptonbacteria bacterium]|nr:hypothetical protein [Candidatus Liptonbacteria bacterium]
MKTLTAIASNTLKTLKVVAILTVLVAASMTSYHLYEISVYGNPSMTPSSRMPLFLILGGFIAALGFLITSIYRNREGHVLREKLNYREQEIANQRARIKELENPLGYELFEDSSLP